MLLDQESLRFIFGLKLKSLRQEKGMSLKSLSQETGLSPSYINEIEKGKKYPKNDKIVLLANALGISYDALISLKLKKELGALSNLLGKNLLRGLPFDVLGLPARSIFELMAERPLQISGLVGTLLELTRKCNVNVEDFFVATLRAFLDMNNNYFPDIEEKAEKFYKKLPQPLNTDILAIALKKDFDYDIVLKDFLEFPEEVRGLHFIFAQKEKPTLILNKNISEREKAFVLAKELAFPLLNLKERFNSTQTTQLDSYGQLLNNFQASYFASALLIPRKKFIRRAKEIFGSKVWDKNVFKDWIHEYPGTHESFFHRLSQVLPNFLKMEQIFFLGFNFDPREKTYELTKELHLSELHSPHGVKSTEHYCRRWITVSLLEKLYREGHDLLVGAQRSRFAGTDKEYFCFSIARAKELDSQAKVCFTLGVLIDAQTKKHIKFLDDPNIPQREVADTCEQCGVSDCKERAASPSRLEDRLREEKIQEAIEGLSLH